MTYQTIITVDLDDTDQRILDIVNIHRHRRNAAAELLIKLGQPNPETFLRCLHEAGWELRPRQDDC